MVSVPAPPKWLKAEPRLLSSIAATHDVELVGPDRSVVGYAPVDRRPDHAAQTLSFATSGQYLRMFLDSDLGACLVPEELVAEVPPDRSVIVTDRDPREVFYAIFARAVRELRWDRLPTHRGAGTQIAASARIHDGVMIGDGSRIMDNVVIMPPTYVGHRVVIKPNATIGGEGFQLAATGGGRRPVPHAGGVVIGDDVTVGSQTCIDRGLFGDFTTVGARTQIDNLVHIAHSAQLGEDVVVVACAEISGSVVVGEGAWLAP